MSHKADFERVLAHAAAGREALTSPFTTSPARLRAAPAARRARRAESYPQAMHRRARQPVDDSPQRRLAAGWAASCPSAMRAARSRATCSSARCRDALRAPRRPPAGRPVAGAPARALRAGSSSPSARVGAPARVPRAPNSTQLLRRAAAAPRSACRLMAVAAGCACRSAC
ncbi:MAG: hypothetical protein MZW92_07760 [Comamonadaceae bacterium]|nr:hypothetical protein [Comamonadaceae bacterium]